jgi:hypothetical protein
MGATARLGSNFTRIARRVDSLTMLRRSVPPFLLWSWVCVGIGWSLAACGATPAVPVGDPTATRTDKIGDFDIEWGANRITTTDQDGARRNHYGWEVPRGTKGDWSKDLWGLGGERAERPLECVSSVSSHVAKDGATRLWMVCQIVASTDRITGAAHERRWLLVDGKLQVIADFDEGVALQKNIFNVFADANLELEAWRKRREFDRNCYLYSSKDGIAFDPASGRVVRLPPNGALRTIRTDVLLPGRPAGRNTEASLLEWRVERDDGARSVLLFPDLTPMLADLVDLRWSSVYPKKVAKDHDPAFRYWGFLSFRYRTEVGWAAFTWVDHRHIHQHALLHKSPFFVGERQVRELGPNLVGVSFATPEEAGGAIDAWVVDLVGQFAAVHKLEVAEMQRLAELERRRIEAARQERAKRRADLEAPLVVELERLVAGYEKDMAQKRFEAAAQTMDAFVEKAHRQLSRLAPEESPVVVDACQRKVAALAQEARHQLMTKGALAEGFDYAAAVREAQAMASNPAADSARAAHDLGMLRMCSAIANGDSPTAFASRNPGLPQSVHALWGETAKAYQQKRRVDEAPAVIRYREPTLAEQLAGFFTAGASVGLSPPVTGGGGVSRPGGGYSSGTSDTMRWVAQQQWQARCDAISNYYSRQQYHYQNKY